MWGSVKRPYTCVHKKFFVDFCRSIGYNLCVKRFGAEEFRRGNGINQEVIMNKTEFIKAVAAKADLSIKDATAAVEAYAAVVADAMKGGDKVALAGFGTYELKHKPERTGFNPITKETIVIGESNAPVLKFGKAFKDLFN